MAASWLNRILMTLAGLGLFIAGTLLYAHTAHKALPCGMTSGCDIVAQSAYSKWFGIPVPVYGVMGYLMLLCLSVGRAFLPKDTAKLTIIPGLIVALGGTLISGYLVFTLKNKIGVDCMWCYGSALTMLATLLVNGFLASADWTAEAPHWLDKSLAFGVPLIALSAIGYNTTILTKPYRPVVFVDPGELKITDLLDHPYYTKGDPNAKVTIIEFADFRCPGCRATSDTLDKMLTMYPKGLRVAYRHFPLFNKPGHEMSVPSAIACEIAGEHGKYWDFIHLIFSPAGDEVPNVQAVIELLVSSGVDRAEAEKRMANKDKDPALDRVVASFDFAGKLKVDTTPTFVIWPSDNKGRPALAAPEQLEDFLKNEYIQKLIYEGASTP